MTGADVSTLMLGALSAGSVNGSSSSLRWLSKRVTLPVRTSETRPRSSTRAKSIAPPTRGISVSIPETEASREATYCAPMHRDAASAASRRLLLLGATTIRRQIPSRSRRNVQVAVCAAYLISNEESSLTFGHPTARATSPMWETFTASAGPAHCRAVSYLFGPISSISCALTGWADVRHDERPIHRCSGQRQRNDTAFAQRYG